MTAITNFDSIRVGSGFPVALEVSRLDGHESDGLVASLHSLQLPGYQNFFQLRLSHQQKGLYFLLILHRPEQEDQLPPFWADSTIIFDSREGDK